MSAQIESSRSGEKSAISYTSLPVPETGAASLPTPGTVMAYDPPKPKQPTGDWFADCPSPIGTQRLEISWLHALWEPKGSVSVETIARDAKMDGSPPV